MSYAVLPQASSSAEASAPAPSPWYAPPPVASGNVFDDPELAKAALLIIGVGALVGTAALALLAVL